MAQAAEQVPRAGRAAGILREVGYDEATIERVGALLKKESLKSDADAQALEDVVDLVFLESYLADFVAKHDGYDAGEVRGHSREDGEEDVAARARGRADADRAAAGARAGVRGAMGAG